MVVGDVVSEVLTLATATGGSFQPAAGVEIMVTGVAGQVKDVLTLFFLRTAAITVPEFATGADASLGTIKIGINNAIHLGFFNNNAAARQFAWTGIQIQ